MPAEQFSNNAQTTVNQSGFTNASTSLTVAAATGFPSQAQYRILVEQELMLVTAGAGTTTWTVTRGIEGTTAAAHALGVPIVHVVTSGAMSQAFARLDQNNSFTAVMGNTGIQWSPTVTASGALAVGERHSPTLVAAVNSDALNVIADTGITTIATGTFTGLTARGLFLDAASWTKTGTGTIANAYGLHVTAPTIGAVNTALRVDGQMGFNTAPSSNTAIRQSNSATATSNVAALYYQDGSLSAAANNDGLYGFEILPFFHKGAFTNLNTIGVYINGPAIGADGTGTIGQAYGLYATAPSIGTSNYAAVFTGGNVGIGTASPLTTLHVELSSTTAYASGTPTVTQVPQIFRNPAADTNGMFTGMQFNLPTGANRVGFIGMVSRGVANQKADLVFMGDDGGSRTEKMRLTAEGYLGLGVVPTTVGLHVVYGGAGNAALINQTDIANPNNAILVLQNNGSNRWYITETGHQVSVGSAPTLGALQGGATAQSIVGTDTRGVVNFTSPAGGIASSAAVFALTFATSYGSSPSVIVCNNHTNVFSIHAYSVSASGFNGTIDDNIAGSTSYPISYVVLGAS